MARKSFEEQVAELAAEERNQNTQPAETQPAEPETQPQENRAEELARQQAERNAELQQQTQQRRDDLERQATENREQAAQQATQTQSQTQTPPAEDPIADDLEKNNAYIRKRLASQAQKYEGQMKAMNDEWQKKFDDLAKQVASQKPAPVQLTRDMFTTDEQFVAALTQQQIDASDAKKAETQRQKDAELAKQRQEQELEEQNIRARQERFNTNVANSFTDPEERKTFLQRVQFVASKGFGDLLDANPTASEYLLGSPNGPRVLNKIINSKEEFNRVFPVTGISALEQFYELKRIENDLARERAEAQQRQQAEQVPERLRDLAPRNPPPAVRLGKPGAQGQAGGDPMSDPKARRDYVRKLMGI